MFEAILHPIILVFAWIWVYIHKALTLVGVPDGPGVGWVISIVILTILVRFAILPLYLKQIRSMRSMSVLQPEMQKIQAKYKGKKDSVSRQRQSEETMALYKKHGASPYASCLPILVQMPVLLGLYRVIFAAEQIKNGTYQYTSLGPLDQSVATDIDASTVLGVGLSQTISTTPDLMGKAVFVIFILVMVGFQFLTMRLSMTKNMAPNQDPNNPMVRSQKTMMYMMPLMFIFTGVIFRMGLLVYMVTTTLFGFFQQVWVNRTMPTPGSPAYIEVLDRREASYKSWAVPEFEGYDEAAKIDDGDPAALDLLQSTTLATVEKKARRERVSSKFPEDWSITEKLAVYRGLAKEPWKTLPDEVWAKQIALAKKSQEQIETARRNQPKKLSREQRQRRATHERLEREAAERRAERQSGAGLDNANGGKTELTPAEVERRRQQRRAQRRQQGKGGSK